MKTKHPRLEITKVVAGMSGSPIYLNDKMIGAYAYGWSFGSEPVAGVTPIRNMLDEMARPLPERTSTVGQLHGSCRRRSMPVCASARLASTRLTAIRGISRVRFA